MLYFALYTQVSDVKSTYNAPPQLSNSSSSGRSDAKEEKIKSGDIDLSLSLFLSFFDLRSITIYSRLSFLFFPMIYVYVYVTAHNRKPTWNCNSSIIPL